MARFTRWLLAAALLIGLLVPTAPAQPRDSLLEGSFWRAQGLRTILPAWTDRARAPDGLFYADLDRSWMPTDSSTVYPGMLARHLFSYAAAFLMSGNDTHLRRAAPILDFLIEHGWDERYGGWYNAVTRSGRVLDPEKDLFMQIYATTGLALYTIATDEERAETYLRRSQDFVQTHAWDDEYGGYVDVLNRDGSVKSSLKDFSPQLAPLSGYLLYLYPATRDTAHLQQAERIMNLALSKMRDDRGWILERYSRDWTFLPDDGKNSHVNVGHNLEVAWLLLRLHALTGEASYRSTGLAITDQLLEHAFHRSSGAWRSKLKRTDPSTFPSTTTWWVQAYGNLLQLYAYRTTGADRYLRAFHAGARFWNEHFVDRAHGGTVLRANLDGGVADGAKAVRTKTSYHAMEHALLASLYVDLWVNDTTTTLHYRTDGSRDAPLYPLPIEDLAASPQEVIVNGSVRNDLILETGAIGRPETDSASIRVLVEPSSGRP